MIILSFLFLTYTNCITDSIFAQYLDLTDSNLDLTDLPSHKSVGLTAKEVIKRQMLNFLDK